MSSKTGEDQLDQLTGLELETAKVWAFKERFRQFPNFRVAILFFLGKLDIYPQTFR